MPHHALSDSSSSDSGQRQKPGAFNRKSGGKRAADSGISKVNASERKANANIPDTVETCVERFLRALRAQLVAMRIYQKNHSLVISAMEATEFHLRAALDRISPLTIGIEDGALMCCANKGAEPLALENKKVWAGLIENWTARGLRTLTFTQRTNLGELDVLARLLNGSHPRADQEWQARLTEECVAGIRANVPMRQPQGTILATLVSTLIAHGAGENQATLSGAAPTTLEDLTAALCLIARFEPIVRAAATSAPEHTADTLHIALMDAERRTLAQIVRAMSRNAPGENETGERYLARLAETLLIETLRDQFLAGRLAAPEVRGVFTGLCEALVRAMNLANGTAETIHGASALPPALVRAARALLPNIPNHNVGAADACIARLHEEFWEGLPAREKSSIVRGPEAWCVPVPVLRRYVGQLANAARNGHGDAPVRESRIVILSYVRGLELEQARARRIVANGLTELLPIVERLWRSESPVELGRATLRVLVNEDSPGIAGILVGLVEGLAGLAIGRGDFAEVERILATLEAAPRDAEHAHLTALAGKLVSDENWDCYVNAALAEKSRDGSLPHLLKRYPERLVESLGALLSTPEGLDALPAMARLTTAVGEPVLGVLEAHLYDPRRQRTATAIKLLAATEPQRLVAALPRALAGWDWNLQDLAVAEVSRRESGPKPAGVARAFAAVLREAHALVAPVMLDEIGIAGEISATPLLCEIAAGSLEPLRDVFIRIKAIEALGRMRAGGAAALLRTLLRARQGLVHSEPAGLRAAAEEALALIENHPSSARVRARKEALTKASPSHGRPRRYLRIPLDHPYTAQIESHRASQTELREDARTVRKMAAARVRSISLGGAFLESTNKLNVGDHIRVDIRAGLRHICSTAVVRNVSAAGGGVEFLHMPEDSRERLRRLVQRLVD